MTTQLKASLPPRQPLKADYSSQSQLVSAKKSSSLALDPEDPAPVAFLRGLFGLSGSGDRVLFNPFQTSSRKPTQENIDSYSLEAVKAIRDKNEDKLRLMISEGKSLDACNRFGESLMHMACRRGDLSIVKLMLFEANVRLDLKDDFGRTPLHDACWTTKPNFDVLDLLLKACPPDLLLAEDVRGHTPFHYARKEHWDGTPLLDEFNGGNASIPAQRAMVSLFVAVRQGNQCLDNPSSIFDFITISLRRV